MISLAMGAAMKPRSLSLIEAAARRGEILVSPISAWEIGLIAVKQRHDIPFEPSPEAWFDNFMRLPGVGLAALTPRIAIRSSFLPGTPHGDPIDRILIATAIEHNARLVTRDRKILEYAESGFVRVLTC
jgi:PIN domain nuclease of toxin-antitoxin system